MTIVTVGILIVGGLAAWAVDHYQTTRFLRDVSRRMRFFTKKR